jgi:hypothetical protein
MTGASAESGGQCVSAREPIPHLTSSTCCCDSRLSHRLHILSSSSRRGRAVICTCEYSNNILW